MKHADERTPPTFRVNEAPDEILPVVEEFVEVSKRTVETGAIRVRTVPETVIEEISTETKRHTANITRRAIDVQVDAEYDPHQEGNEWVIPVFEYRPTVSMQLFLKEEIRVAHHVENLTATMEIPVVRHRVIIERRDGETGPWQETNKDDEHVAGLNTVAGTPPAIQA